MYTKEELLRRRAALSASKHDLLAQQLRGQAADEQTPREPIITIPRRSPSDVIPLSSIQERFWFLQQLDPMSVSYVNAHMYQLPQAIDVDLLSRAVREIARRHEILRTTYHMHNGQIEQRVDPARYTTFDIPLVELQHLPEPGRSREAKRVIDLERSRPLPLHGGPPWSLLLVRVEPEAHLLLVRFHHLISDGWSIDTIVRQELLALYHAYLVGQPSPLRDLPIQYGDYAVWQRQQLLAGRQEAQLDYWLRHLEGAPLVLDLPTDAPRPAVQAYRERGQPVHISASLTAQLKQLCQQEHATLFMALLAAFGTLFGRLAGQNDLLIGTSLAGRQLPELEPLLGCFINTLPLRVDMRAQPTFRELIRQMRQAALGAFANQDLPIEQIISKIEPRRDLSRSLLYQVMFQMQNFPSFEMNIEGLRQSEEDEQLEYLELTSTGQGLCDIILLLFEGETITGELVYDANLFATETIERMLHELNTLLAAALADPDCPIDRLPLLDADETHRVLVDWNASTLPLAQNAAAHTLFEQRAAETPDNVAVVWQEQLLTYAQLNRRANQLARYLRRQGVGVGDLVGICVERSLELIVSVMAVLKAGAAYVPLACNYPEERLAFMLRDSGACLLLTQQHLGVLRRNHAARVLDLEREQSAIEAEQDTNLELPVLPGQLAYLIYTSGSTGQPKGALVNHQSVINAYQGWEVAYALCSPIAAHLQMANFSFDVFVGDLVRALCSGGELVLCPGDLLVLPQRLYGLMREQRIDCAEFVPAVLRGLVAYLEESGERLDFVRLLVCASDTWYADEYERIRRVCGPDTQIINSFGLTEATIDSTFFVVHGAVTTSSGQVPIGHPFPNTQAYILDAGMQPVPIGVTGELYIGGAGLAHGYYARPGLTAERFVPNPFRTEPGGHMLGSRLYRTGDRARYLQDGTIEFLGRGDQQIKIRGQRIELGELESALLQHFGVQEAAALVCPGAASESELIACIVPRPEANIDTALADELQSFLRARLPDAMVPTAFIAIETMPLTPNGKIDRKALAVYALAQPAQPATYVMPSTPIEQELAMIWQAVLNREAIGIYDNFFALGGHSLLVGQLIYRLNMTFAVDLPLRRVFQDPTIAQLALAIEELWLSELEATEHIGETRQLLS